MLCDHKCRIEANAELTDDVDVVLLFVFAFLNASGTGMRDRTEVVLHSSAVVPQPWSSMIKRRFALSKRQLNQQTVAGDAVLPSFIALYSRAYPLRGCVGISSRRRDFLVRINGVDHQNQAGLGFCSKLLEFTMITYTSVFVVLVLALSTIECQH